MTSLNANRKLEFFLLFIIDLINISMLKFRNSEVIIQKTLLINKKFRISFKMKNIMHQKGHILRKMVFHVG